MKKLMPLFILLVPFVFIAVWIGLFHCLQPLAIDDGTDKFISGLLALMGTMYAAMALGFENL